MYPKKMSIGNKSDIVVAFLQPFDFFYSIQFRSNQHDNSMILNPLVVYPKVYCLDILFRISHIFI